MNTFNKIKEEIVVEDIPLNKWVCVVIRVENHNMDVNINGVIVVMSWPVFQNKIMGMFMYR